MPSINEVLNLAKMNGFEYAIMFVDQTGEVKVAIGLNGLTKKISDAINSYIRLLDNFNVKYTKVVYDVRSSKEITILDIPMYFTVIEDTSGNNFLPRPSGYM
jgi:hypothetical protein